MQAIVWLISGLLAGWLARVVMKGKKSGFLGDVVLGILGGVIGACMLGSVGGKVPVAAELRDDPLGRRVKISVRDTGIGISPQDLERLARPFEQVESQHSKTTQGTGLGLALTKSLVEMHGGLLDLKSAPGQGTIASFALPLQQSRPAAVTTAAA